MDRARDEGYESPGLYEGYPEDLAPYLHDYLEAFFRLSKSRTYTMGGAAYIPLSEIVVMSRLWHLDDEETERFIDYIQALDDEYVSAVNADSRSRPQAMPLPAEPAARR